MATALAGRATVDLSIGPLIGFINVTLIQLGAADIVSSPIGVFAYALAAGVAYQLVFGLIVIWVRVQPIIVSLSGFLALSGINLVILPRPGGAAPEWMANWGAGHLDLRAEHVHGARRDHRLVDLLHDRAFYGHLRLMGSDERAAYTSGVRIGIVRHRRACGRRPVRRPRGARLYRADQFGRSFARHDLHADLRDRPGPGRHEPRRRPRDGDRLAARRAEPVSDRLRPLHLRFRLRARLRHRSELRRHSRAFAAADGRSAAICSAGCAMSRRCWCSWCSGSSSSASRCTRHTTIRTLSRTAARRRVPAARRRRAGPGRLRIARAPARAGRTSGPISSPIVLDPRIATRPSLLLAVVGDPAASWSGRPISGG